jgi:hypothetical protein
MNSWIWISFRLVLQAAAALNFMAPAVASVPADTSETAAEVIPGDEVSKEPFLGDWEGQWSKGFPRQIVAQVIPRAAGVYQVNFLPVFDHRCPEEFEFYEVQILDSYGLPGYWDECGAIYNKAAPKVNMCAPPGQWQTYDITYRSPKFDESGRLVARARITVNHNGRLIHHQMELPYSQHAIQRRNKQPDARTPGRITLQHHGDPVDFRNIWLLPLSGDQR